VGDDGAVHPDRLDPPAGTEHLFAQTWLLRAGTPEAPRALLAPDPRPSALLRLEAGALVRDPLRRTSLPERCLLGPRRTPLLVEGEGRLALVRLRAGALAALGRTGALLDQVLPLDDAVDAEVTEVLRALASRARPVPGRAEDVERALEVLESRRGIVTATGLGRALGLPPSILEGAVQSLLGASLPELGAATVFRHALGGERGPVPLGAALRAIDRLRRAPRPPRERRRVTGMSPAELEELREALAAAPVRR